MRRYLIALPLLALAEGCTENTFSGTEINGGGTFASGAITERSDGAYALSLPVTGGYCTAVISTPSTGGRELRPLACSGGESGNVPVICSAAATPSKVVHGGVGINSGTIESWRETEIAAATLDPAQGLSAEHGCEQPLQVKHG